MLDIAFRKEMTPMAPLMPSQEGMGFHPHRYRDEKRRPASSAPPHGVNVEPSHGRNQRRHSGDAGKRSSKPLSAHTTTVPPTQRSAG